MQNGPDPDGTNLDEALKQRLLDREMLPPSVTVKGVRYDVHGPVAAGITGAVWQATDEFSRPRALKLATPKHYDHRSHLEELTRAGKLEPYSEFARLYDAAVQDVTLEDGSTHKFVVFVEEWVEGQTLKAVIENSPELHTASFFRAFVSSFSSVLAALDAVGLRHDDLNPKNVMIVPPRPGSLDQAHTLKIVDLASLKPRDRKQKKPRDDHDWFVEHLVMLWNAIKRRKSFSVRERRFLDEAEALLRTMLDDDVTIRLADPSQCRQHFEQAYTRSQSTHRAPADSLRDPFDFISAEHISDDSLLVRLFAQSCPWLDKVMGPDPCLLTGPRGCGKSTLFRWLSLKAQLLARPTATSEEFDRLTISGFYISCSADLQNRLAGITTEHIATQFQRDIIHYFNLLATREVVQTLALIATREDTESYWGLGQTQQQAIHAFLVDQLPSIGLRRLQGVPLLDQAVDLVERAIFIVQASLAARKRTDSVTNASFLGDLSVLLTKEMPIFSQRRIAFLVDDFSAHRVSLPVQTVLNQVIWERRSSHVFKLSSEKYGASFDTIQGATAELTREMIEIDCGQEFIALDDANKQAEAIRFATDLLDNRLREAGYEGTTTSLIGSSHWPDGSLGRALRSKRDNPGRHNDQYHGIECISQLCSGDVASLLYTYRAMFAEGGVTKVSRSQISKQKQHKAIKAVSQKMFTRIRTYHPFGSNMFEIVNQFGTLVRKILEAGREIRHGSGRAVPPQCPRIEIDQVDGAVSEQLSDQAKQTALELVRRGIFIEMEPGLSRHGNVTSFRWQLRRIFLPAFNASLSKNDAIKRAPDWLNFFLLNPREACDSEWLRRPKEDDGRKKDEDDGEPPLFKGANR